MPAAPDAKPYLLYGMEISYYTGKARSYLRYKKIPYREVLSTLWIYRRFIIPRTGVAFIPVVQTPDNVVVQDTTDIIDFLEQRFPQPSVYPATPRQKLVALLFELYGDEWLLLPAMHYRWHYMPEHGDEVMAQFGRVVAPKAPAPLRRLFGRRLSRRFKQSLPILGVTTVTRGAIEAWYLEFLDRMNAHFAQHRYLLGDRASIGDFGLMGPLYAHLGRDPSPKRLMETRAPHVTAWVARMNATDQQPGDFLPGDEIPETLLPVLRRMFDEHFPVLRDTVAQLEQWLDAHPGEKIPRVIGRHRFRIGDAEETRGVFPYAQWMLQRPLDYYRGLSASDCAAVDELLAQVGGLEAMQIQIRRRVVRRENRLAEA